MKLVNIYLKMGRQCCVPGCTSGRYTDRKRNQERKIRNPSLFRLPGIAMLEKWSEAIPITSRQRSLTMDCVVCDLHFEEKYINRYFEKMKMPDGAIFRVERERPSLVSGAIPTIFPYSLNNVLNSRIQTCVAEPSVKEKLRRLEFQKEFNLENKNSTNINIDEETMEILTPSSIKEEPPFEEQNSQNICSATNAVEHSPMHPIALDNSVFNFNFLVRNLSDIDKPSSWAISLIREVESNYVMCAMWRNYQVEKRVVIDASLNIKVFLKEKQIVRAENEKVYCLGDIAGLLEKINYYELCPGIDKGMNDCLQFVDKRFINLGRPCAWCSECRLKKVNSRTSKALTEKERLERKGLQYSLLSKQFRAVKNQNRILKKRVERLRTRLKYFEEDYNDIF